jgi:HK97 family phage prohead protease
MAKNDLKLITSATFRTMARKGAKADDFVGSAVLKAGTIARVKAVGDAGARTIAFILSNANLDREGDSIAVPGWDLKPYQDNPVVLWAHDHGGLPVGRATKTYVDGPNLKAIDEFATPDLYPFGDCVYRFLKAGYLNACSVGFQPSVWEMTDTGVDFKQQTLLEHSVCPVPAHPEALVIARAKGIDTGPLQAWAERALDLYHLTGDAAGRQREQLDVLRIQADPKGRKLFTVLSSLKMPTGTDAGDAAELAQLMEMQSTVASCGVNLSVAASALTDLLGTVEPAGASQEVDEEAADVALLTAVAENCATAAAGLVNVGAQAVLLGGAAPKAAASTITKANRAALVRTLDDLKIMRRHAKSGRVLSAANEAALRRAIAELDGVLQQLDAGDGQALMLDGKRLLDDEDILGSISEKEIQEILVKVVVDEMMKETGRVW